MRKLLSLILLLATAAATSAELKKGMGNWLGNPITWQESADGFCTTASGGPLQYTPAPLSENCEIEAVINVRERRGESYSTAGVGLWNNGGNYYHLALVEAPVAQKGNHFIELHQKFKGQWPSNDNLTVAFNSEPNIKWKYNTPYRLKIAKVKDEITGTVTELDGTLLFKRTVKFKDDTPVNYVRPFLSTDSMILDYSAIKADWSGKTVSGSTQGDFPKYFCDSYLPNRRDTATGFFHVKQDPDGRWWAYDPLGRGFVVFGIDHVSYWGHGCEILNRWLHREYNDVRFNKDVKAWQAETLDRLTSWGFNMLMGSDGSLRQRGMAHAIIINVGDIMATFGDEYDITPNLHAPCTAFPNVFHPQFRNWVAYRVNLVCKAQANNPWLFGYFIDNELCWWGRGSNYGGLFDTVLRKDGKHTAKLALRDFLKAKANNDIAVFNATWNTTLKSFDDILNLTGLPNNTEQQKDIKTAFLELIAERYFGTVHEELRKVDRNHMLLGCRFAGIDGSHPVVWKTAAKYSDVLTWNYYGNVDLDAEAAFSTRGFGGKNEPLMDDFKRVYDWTGRPCLITEWSFPALDSGLPCTYGAGQRFRTQAERAKATEIFARTMLAMPFLIGYDYFMWVDQPPLGISHAFPENSNYGIINLKGEPYQGLVKLFTDIQHNAEAARLATIPPPKPVASPSHELYDAWLAPHPVKTGNCPVQFTQNAPNQFTAANGRFTLRSQPGEPFVDIQFDGKPLGTFGALAYYTSTANTPLWCDITELISVQAVPETDRLTLIFTARFIPQQNSTGKPFEMTYKLLLLPNADWMLAEITQIRNIGEAPLELRGLFLRSFARFDNKPEVAFKLERQLVPRLWGAPKFTAWISPDEKQYVAFTCGPHDDMTLRCWYDENRGSYHPDLSRFLNPAVTLQPGAIYKPAAPLYVAAFAGSGNLSAAQAAALNFWK